MFFGAFARGVLVAIAAFWLTCFLVARAAVFHEAWHRAHARRQDDAWLLAQCRNPEFYAKLRHRVDLCAQVQSASERDPLQEALAAVAHTTHLCGERPCMDVLLDDGLLLPAPGGWWPHGAPWAAVGLGVAAILWLLLSRAARAMTKPAAVRRPALRRR